MLLMFFNDIGFFNNSVSEKTKAIILSLLAAVSEMSFHLYIPNFSNCLNNFFGLSMNISST